MPTPNLGFLRQWLNERDQSKLVTNEDLWVFLKPAYEAYAQARFDEAMVEEEKIKILGDRWDDGYEMGYNECRQTIINNWNAQSKE